MDFIENIATDRPVPGGGAAAAYASCLATGLLYKVVLIQLHRERDNDEMNESRMVAARKEVRRLLDDLERLIAKDPECYTRFAESKKGQDQKEMKVHFTELMETSMKVLEKSFSALEWAAQMNQIVPEQMKPQLRVAIELLIGAINGTFHVTGANLQAIKHQKKKENYLKRLEELHQEAVAKYEKVQANIRA